MLVFDKELTFPFNYGIAFQWYASSWNGFIFKVFEIHGQQEMYFTVTQIKNDLG